MTIKSLASEIESTLAGINLDVTEEVTSENVNGPRKARIPPGKMEKNFECDVCHKKYARLGILQKHLKVHGEGKFTCAKCLKRFETEAELSDHNVVHSNDRVFPCNWCLNSFTEEKHLKTHLKR